MNRWKLTVNINTNYKALGHNTYFADKVEAVAAKEAIIAARKAYEEKRPNAWDERLYTITHDLGETTFNLNDVESITLWDAEQSRTDDLEEQEKIAAINAKVIAEIVSKALVAGMKE